MAGFSYEQGACACNRDKCSYDCETYRRWNPPPPTRADRIRAMTDEELAEVINDQFYFYGLHKNPGMCDVCDHDSLQNCKQCWLDWLRQEAEG